MPAGDRLRSVYIVEVVAGVVLVVPRRVDVATAPAGRSADGAEGALSRRSRLPVGVRRAGGGYMSLTDFSTFVFLLPALLR